MDVDYLIGEIAKGQEFHYLFFWGHTAPKDGSISKSCLSQWYPASFHVDGVDYKTTEHFMMAEKARLFDDAEIREEIFIADTPKEAKALGRKVAGFNGKTWLENRCSIVEHGNYAKFSQNEALKEFLLSTEDAVLVEASPYDKIWGIGMKANHPDVQDPAKWNGLNLLGFALMDVRERLKG